MKNYTKKDMNAKQWDFNQKADNITLQAKAITVHQPYADLIIKGIKTLEIRSWRTNYRGPLFICSSKTILPNLHELHTKYLSIKKLRSYHNNYYKHGVIVGMVELIDIRPYQPCDVLNSWCQYVDKHWAWEMDNPIELDNYSIRGRPGLFNIKLELNRQESANIPSEFVDVKTF